MIQRVQTVYLFIASLLVAMSLFMPMMGFMSYSDSFNLHAMGLKDVDGEVVQRTIYMFALLVICAVLPFVNIFLYNNRMLQVRLCIMEGVLLIGANVIIGVYLFLSNRVFMQLETETFFKFKPALIFPLIAVFFIYLAAKAIFNDELKIRSVDRIR